MALFDFSKLFNSEMPEMRKELRDVIDVLQFSKHPIALTGAGISVESGIPDFRGPQGIWKRFSPSQFVRENFTASPEKFWKMVLPLLNQIKKAKPNKAHFALAQMERLGYIKAVITQNIDLLHQKAGSKKVIEFHGNLTHLRCPRCGERYKFDIKKMKKIPRCSKCGTILLPEITFFGDQINSSILEMVNREISYADVLLIIGTSAAVEPASQIPYLVKEKGGTIIEINIQPTYLTEEITDIFIPCEASLALDKLSKALSTIL